MDDNRRRDEGSHIAVGTVDFGHLRRLVPISNQWGYDRGLPIDRYYIERFLQRNAADIRGRVLEVGDDAYTRRFGEDRVTSSDVINLYQSPSTTIQADLASAPQIPSNSFDCIILTQTLQLIYDLRSAVATLYRILSPGGVLLATFPGITHTQDGQWSQHWCWSLTPNSARRLFAECFPPEALQVEAYGNVLTAISFLHGIAAEELQPEELDFRYPAFDVTIALRATKPRRVGALIQTLRVHHQVSQKGVEEPRSSIWTKSIRVRASSVPNTCNLVIESAMALFQILACLFKRSRVLLVFRQPSLSVN